MNRYYLGLFILLLIPIAVAMHVGIVIHNRPATSKRVIVNNPAEGNEPYNVPATQLTPWRKSGAKPCYPGAGAHFYVDGKEVPYWRYMEERQLMEELGGR